MWRKAGSPNKKDDGHHWVDGRQLRCTQGVEPRFEPAMPPVLAVRRYAATYFLINNFQDIR